MRADRLVAMLLQLQSHGRMTAAELARRLEVSERTVYRDLAALGSAGIPVYAERGPGGGCELMAGYRTNLTGLTADEARTLFMSGAGAALKDLGLGAALDGALLKLLAALPTVHRQDAERARQRLHLDPLGWNQGEETVPHLRAIQEALFHDRKLLLTYRKGNGEVGERLVNPLGLVSKANIWYLVGSIAGGEMRVFRVSRTQAVVILDEPCERPAEFDLPAFWEASRENFRATFPRYPVRVRVAPEMVAVMPQIYGESVRARLAEAGPPDADGWLTIELVYESMDAARSDLLGIGPEVEVIEPVELRASLVAQAARVLAYYTARGEITAGG
jgi:predicted DNA-binding transcriptional regulator YafY